jgi:hypothetical protein
MPPWITLNKPDPTQDQWELAMNSHLEPAFQFLRTAHVLSGSTLDEYPASDRAGDTDHEFLVEESQANFTIRHATLAQWPEATRDKKRTRWIVSESDIETLLQSLNDLRIFCWLRLGSPDPLPEPGSGPFDLQDFPSNPASLKNTLAIASMIQEFLLQALHTSRS